MPTTELAIPVARESTYIVVWEFQVKKECQAEFVAAYGPDGDWARLFRRSPEFLGVELLGSVGTQQSTLKQAFEIPHPQPGTLHPL